MPWKFLRKGCGMDNTTSKFAKAYAAYISGWLGRSIYDAWFMFFAQIIWDAKTDVLDVVKIRDEFNRRYSINIPIDFVTHTLSFKRDLFALNRNMVTVVDRLMLEKYITPERSYIESWNLLKAAFNNFCANNGLQIDSDVESVILDCVESYDVDVVAPHGTDSFNSKCDLSYRWNVFVRALKETDPDLFDFVCALCYGSIAKESILCTEGVGVVFRGLNVYLDTPLIFQLLGIADSQEQESAACLISGLVSAGCNLWVFRHTLEEVNLIARSSKRWALDVCNYDPSRASKTARFFRNQRYTDIEIEELICDIEGDLKSRFGIKIDDMANKESVHRLQRDEKCLREMFDEKYEYADEDEKADKARGIENDIRSIVLLYHLRAGVRPKNFHQCRILMVTSSSTMANVCRNFANRDAASCQVPVCVSSKILASFLWFGNHKKLINYKRLELLADCSRFLKPTDRILRKFFAKVSNGNMDDDLARKKYFMLVTTPALDQVLMATIKGNEENITDNTIDEVCERLRADIISQHTAKEKHDEQQRKYEYKKRRNKRLKKYVSPLSSLLLVILFMFINGITAAIIFLLKGIIDEATFVGYIVFAIVDALCVGGFIHEKWGVRFSKRWAIRLMRAIFGFFQF